MPRLFEPPSLGLDDLTEDHPVGLVTYRPAGSGYRRTVYHA